jgi:hypothetical protein
VRKADGFRQIRGRIFIRASVAVCRSASAVDQRPKGQLKALFLSWKSSVEFSRREVIQEQWDVDVGGG